MCESEGFTRPVISFIQARTRGISLVVHLLLETCMRISYTYVGVRFPFIPTDPMNGRRRKKNVSQSELLLILFHSLFAYRIEKKDRTFHEQMAEPFFFFFNGLFRMPHLNMSRRAAGERGKKDTKNRLTSPGRHGVPICIENQIAEFLAVLEGIPKSI